MSPTRDGLDIELINRRDALPAQDGRGPLPRNPDVGGFLELLERP